MSWASHAVATVDFPEPDRPVNHTVAPCEGRSDRSTCPACQVTLVLLNRSVAERGEDHAGADGGVGGLVDEDEAPGGAVAPVLVVEERQRGAERHAPDRSEEHTSELQS